MASPTEAVKYTGDYQALFTAAQTSASAAATSEANAGSSETACDTFADRAEKAAVEAQNAGSGYAPARYLDGTPEWVWSESTLTEDSSGATGSGNAWSGGAAVFGVDGTFYRELSLSTSGSNPLYQLQACAVTITCPFDTDAATINSAEARVLDSGDNIIRAYPLEVLQIGGRDLSMGIAERIDLMTDATTFADSIYLYLAVSGAGVIYPRVYLAQFIDYSKFAVNTASAGYTVTPGKDNVHTFLQADATIVLPDISTYNDWSADFCHRATFDNGSGTMTLSSPTDPVYNEASLTPTTRGATRHIRLNDDHTAWVVTY